MKSSGEKQPSDAGAKGNEHPGCVWGILHIMKYHHWHHVKKRLKYKRRGSNKNSAGVADDGDCGDACRFPRIAVDDVDMDKKTTPAEEKTNPLSPTSRASIKARIKARITEEMAKKRARLNRSPSYSLRSQLTRIDSMHHFEPPSDMDPIAEMVLSEVSPRPVAHNKKENFSAEESNSRVKDKGAGSSPMSVTEDPKVDHVPVNEDQKDEPLSPDQLDNNTVQDMLEKKLIHVKELDEDSSVHHQKEYLEALDILNVNKELLVKILHDPSSPLAQQFHNQQAVSAKMNLTKAPSFPMPGSSGKGGSKAGSLPTPGSSGQGSSGPSKLKPKNEPHDVSPAPKPTWSTSLKYAGERPMPSITYHNMESSSSPSHPSLRSQGEHSVAIKRFKDLRHKIKHVIKESKQDRRMISMDAVLHKIPHGKKLTKELEKEIVSHTKDPALHREGKDCPISSCASDHSVSPVKKTKIHHMRRTSSFDASSLDKYRKLYETTSFKEAKDQPSSERLIVRAEESGSLFQSSSFRKAPKSLGRIFSLPDMESYYQNEDSSDAFPPGLLFKTGVDENANRQSRFKRQVSIGSENELQLDLPKESEVRENLDDATETKAANEVRENLSPETNEVTIDKGEATSVAHDETSCKVSNDDEIEKLAAGDSSISHTEQDTELEAATNIAEPLPASVTNICALEDISSPRKCSQSEGEELEQKHEDGQDNLDDKQGEEPDIDTSNVVIGVLDTEEVETPKEHLSYDMPQVLVNERDMTEFNYVKDVLEFSGIKGNECLGAWRADDPPVFPSVYEVCVVLDPDCPGNEEGGECDHLLLFDLINEVLMEIYGRSHSYCPRALSSLCYIRLMTAGHHVLKEVWALISWYLSLTPEVDQSIDYVLSSDLAKYDGWMNLQFDTECIGIEMEDLIFDELLEEAIWE